MTNKPAHVTLDDETLYHDDCEHSVIITIPVCREIAPFLGITGRFSNYINNEPVCKGRIEIGERQDLGRSYFDILKSLCQSCKHFVKPE